MSNSHKNIFVSIQLIPDYEPMNFGGKPLLRVCPAQEEPNAFAPFELPRMSKALYDRVTDFGLRFWLRYCRSVAVLLLLDCKRQRWSHVVPIQRCSRDLSLWSLSREGLPSFSPDYRLGGVYQTHSFEHLAPYDAVVPAMDGLHITHDIQNAPRLRALFVHLQNQTRATSYFDTVWDENDIVMERCRPRMKLV